jgi:hypothetical protein
MKNFRFVIMITGITFLLFIIGILLSTFVMEITQIVIEKQIIAFRVQSELNSRLSLGFLLAFCSICAGCFYWAYRKIYPKNTPTFLFIFSLLISLISAAIGIWAKLLQIKFAFELLPFIYRYDEEYLAAEVINYFSWGVGYVIFANLIVFFLVWLLLRRKKSINSTLAISNQ